MNLEPGAKRQGAKFMYSNKDKKSNYKERGFTLIEVLMAMAIFSIGILGVGTMQIRSTTGNTSARIRTEASIWAQDRVETLMLLPYNSSPALGVGPAGPGHQEDEGGGSAAGGYTIVWDVSAGATVNTKIIKVTVIGRGNRSSTVTFVRGQDV